MSDDEIKIVIPEINSEKGLTLCSGDRKIYIQSLRLFAVNMPAALTKMRGVTEDTLKIYTTQVHSLKGMCDYIGAEEARKSAKQLEDTAAAGDYKGVLAGNEILIVQIERIIGNINKWLDDNGKNNG